ncbi:MAG: hypothetical protein ABIK09_04305 [Pseudomonadota bacterium]
MTGHVPPRTALRKAILRAWPALVLAMVACAPWLASPMFLDDWHLLWRASQAPWSWAGLRDGFTFLDPTSLSVWNLPPAPAYHYFRPLVVASFKVDLALWGLAPFGFHAVNLALHLVTVVLVGQLSARISGDERLGRIAAVLFAVQPHNVAAVCWTAGRTTSMGAMWMVAALLCYVAARQDRRRSVQAWTLVFTALACLTKESAVLVGVLAAFWEVLERPGPLRTRWRGSLLALLPLAVLLAGFAVFRLLWFDSVGVLAEPYFTAPNSPGFPAFAMAKLVHYAAALLTMAPVVPIFGTGFLQAHPLVLGAVAMLVVLIAVGVHHAGRGQRGRWFGGFWMAAAFLPTLPILASDLYPYFAGIGFALILAAALARPTRGRRIALVVLVCFYLVGFTGRGLLYHVQGVIDRTAMEDIERDFDGPPPEGAHLILVNLPVAASHVTSHLRLRAGRGDIHATLATVTPEWTTPTAGPPVECISGDAIRIGPPPGHAALFATPEEWHIHLFRIPLVEGRSYRTESGITATPRWMDGHVDALKLLFDESLDDGRIRVYSFYDAGDGPLVHRVCGP